MLIPFRKLLVLAVAFAVLFLADRANACSCFSPGLDTAIEDSNNIAILKVQAVEKYRDDEKGYGYGRIKQTRLTVEKVFKGNLKIGQQLIFLQGGGGDCVWTFNEKLVGMEFLFFLNGKSGKKEPWAPFICSRSNSVKAATADLKYLEALPKVKGKTRLSGTLAQEDEPAVEGEFGSYKRLAGRTVTVTGNGKTIRLKTDENGDYEVYDLPPGTYQVTPEKVSGYRFNRSQDSVEVKIYEEGLTEEDFKFEIDNSIRGKFLDSYGNPLKSVSVRLVPARGNAHEDFSQSDSTDKDGIFLFKKIPAGAYLIVVNEENVVTADEPFERFYYPDKIDRAAASEINIGAGDHFKNLIITAPKTADTITVSGVFLYEDGNPVAKESVRFFQNHEDFSTIKNFYEPDSRAETDADGRFSIRILKGQKGILFGGVSVYKSDLEKCPKLKSFWKNESEISVNVRTRAIKINADHDIGEVELKFQFSKCNGSEIKLK